MRVEDVIGNAKYLLEFQKEALLDALADEDLDGELDKELALRTFLDEFFRRVLDIGDITGKLKANESAELDRLVEELTK